MKPLGIQHAEPGLGAHLVTPRGDYEHHGIYVGAGRVVHYAGFCEAWQRGPVEEAALAHFAAGHEVQVVPHANAPYAPDEIVARARSRLGENRYRLLTNNCEHLCAWCIEGRAYSTQVRACLLHPARGLRVIARLLTGYCASRFLAPRRAAAPI
jgi:hypothetical protein